METIMEFKDEYSFLSNFCMAPFDAVSITGGSIIYPHVEAYFQAWKTEIPGEFFNIAIENNPRKSKRLGRKATMRPDWDKIKDRVMLYAVTQKFVQNPPLMRCLRDTRGKLLVEGNRWGDTYWGFDLNKGTGLNKLGTILMYVRDIEIPT